MEYESVAEMAKRWKVSNRTVRNYCALGKIPGAFLIGKTWSIPIDSIPPERINKHIEKPRNLLDVLCMEKAKGISGGIYHKLQVDMTYNSNHIEGSRLTHEQTRLIYETNTIGIENTINVDDITETVNHFRCIDMVIDQARKSLSESFIKDLHRTLMNGTSICRKNRFASGDYKRLPNEVGGRETALPEEVAGKMKALLKSYSYEKAKTFNQILEFHYEFESIHPFQDGNGRIGRLIILKECLRNNIVPFIIDERLKMFYYRGLQEWRSERGYLLDTCLSAQDDFKTYLDYFRIPYGR